MRTKLTIGGIALSVGITGASLVATASMRFGTRQGLGIVAATSVMVVAFYRAAVRPLRSKWVAALFAPHFERKGRTAARALRVTSCSGR